MNYKRIAAGITAAVMAFSSDFSAFRYENGISAEGYYGVPVSSGNNYGSPEYYSFGIKNPDDVFNDLFLGSESCSIEIQGVKLFYERYELHVEITGIQVPYNWGSYSSQSYELFIPAYIDERPVTDIRLDSKKMDMYCGNVSSVTVDEENTYLCVKDGMIFSSDMKKLLYCAPGSDTRSYVVPETVTEIGSCAFYGRNFMRIDAGVPEPDSSVTDPYNNTYTPNTKYSPYRQSSGTGNYGSGTSVLYLGENVKTIGDYAFSNSGMLSAVILPDSIQKIGERAFYYCPSLHWFSLTNPSCDMPDSPYVITVNDDTGLNSETSQLHNTLTVLVPYYGRAALVMMKNEYSVKAVHVSGQIRIDSNHFPDIVFREYVRKNFDDNNDGYLDEWEIDQVSEIKISSLNIKSLSGIELFYNLARLECSGNSIKELNLISASSLEYLDCSYNNISMLNVYECGKLSYLDCSHNSLSKLEFAPVNNSTSSYMNTVSLSDNGRITLTYMSSGASYHYPLYYVDCSENELTELSINSINSISELYCSGNKLETIVLPDSSSLSVLDCSDNRLKSLPECGSALYVLDCHDNSLSEINIYAGTLSYLDCSGNKIFSKNQTGSNLRESCVVRCRTELETDYIPLCGITAEYLKTESGAEFSSVMGPDLSSAVAVSGISTINNGIIYPDEKADSICYRIGFSESAPNYEHPYTSMFNSEKKYSYDGSSLIEVTVNSRYGTRHPDENKDGNCDNCAEKAYSSEKTVALTKENFPDSQLLEYLRKEYDSDSDGFVAVSDVKKIAVSSQTYISDMTGVKLFPALEYLDIYVGNMETLNLSGLNSLTKVNVKGILKSLDVSDCKSLSSLNCSGTELEKLNVSGCSDLKYISCDCNNLTELDISKCTSLAELDCMNNQLKSLDVSHCTELTNLMCSGNQFMTIDIRGLKNLSKFECKNDIILDKIPVCGFTREYLGINSDDEIKLLAGFESRGKYYPEGTLMGNTFSFGYSCSLSTETKSSNYPGAMYGAFNAEFRISSDNTGHTDRNSDGRCDLCSVVTSVPLTDEYFPDCVVRQCLMCFDTDNDGILNEDELGSVTSLGIGRTGLNTADGITLEGLEYLYNLKTLSISDVRIKENSLNLTNCLSLERVDVTECGLDSLYVKELKELDCSDNNIVNLDLSECKTLEKLTCSGNQLEELDLTGMHNLREVYCNDNPLKSVKADRERSGMWSINSEVSFDKLCKCGFTPEKLGFDFDVSEIVSISGAVIKDGKIIPDGTVGKPVSFSLTCDIFFQADEGPMDTHYPLYVTFNVTANSLYEHENKNNDNFCDNCGEKIQTEISVDSFPDENLRKYISEAFDKNKDGILTLDEACTVRLEIGGKDIHSLEGLEFFPKLAEIVCNQNDIKEIDLSGFEKLEYLNCYGCNVEKLNLSGCTSLVQLKCNMNNIKELNLSGLSKLKKIDIYENPVSSLDVSGCTSLTEINLSDCGLSSFDGINITGCSELKKLNLSGNHFTSFEKQQLKDSGVDVVLDRNSLDAGKTACAFSFADLGDENGDMSRVKNVEGAVISDGKFIPESFKITYDYAVYIPEDESCEPVYEQFIIYTDKTYNHAVVKAEYENANCTEDGHEEHWYCTECGTKYSDSEGKKVISAESVLIPAYGHRAYSEMYPLEDTLASPQTENSPAEYYKTCGKCLEPVETEKYVWYTYQDVVNRQNAAKKILENKSDYSKQSADSLENALNSTLDLKETMTQKELETRWKAIRDAENSLRLCDTTVTLVCDPLSSGVLSGGGNYAKGETAHLTSKNISGFRFEGWYDGEELISEKSVYDYTVTKTGELTITARYSENNKINLTVAPGNGTVKYSYNYTEKTIKNKMIKAFPVGTEMTLEAQPNEGYRFLFWIDTSRNRIVSEDEKFTFRLSQSLSYEACYVPEEGDGETHYVIFRDANGTILKAEDVDHGTDAEAPDHFEFNGFTFAGWDSSTENISSDMIISAIYEAETGYTVNADGGTVENAREVYSHGDEVRVTAADSRDGVDFSGWYNGDILVCSTPEYVFRVTSNVNIHAVYDGMRSSEPLINVRLGDRTVTGDRQTVVAVAEWILPEGYTVISAGIIRGFDIESEDILTPDNADGDTVKNLKSDLVCSNGTYEYSFRLGSISMAKSLYTRAYIQYADELSGEIFIAYSDTAVSHPITAE